MAASSDTFISKGLFDWSIDECRRAAQQSIAESMPRTNTPLLILGVAEVGKAMKIVDQAAKAAGPGATWTLHACMLRGRGEY